MKFLSMDFYAFKQECNILVLSIFYYNQWRKVLRNKLRQKFGSFMQNKCLIKLTSEKNKAD